MRNFIELVPVLTLVASSLAAPSSKPAKPTMGVKTPGVQIPFANLKPEAEFPAPAKPDWLFFSGSAFACGKDSLDRIDPKTNKQGEPIAGLSKPCGGMASAFDSLWVPACGTSSLARIDGKTFKVIATIATGVASGDNIIAATDDSIWLETDDKTTLSRVDPDQNMVVAELRVPTGCRGLTFGESALWIACPVENKVLRINPITNLVEQAIKVSEQPDFVAAGEGSIWVLCRKDGKIDRIDPKTNKVSKTIELGVPGAGGQMALGGGFLWVTQPGFPLTRIDVKSETVVQQFRGEGGGAIAVSPGAIWLSNVKAATVWRIDPKRVFATLPE
jgi:virginiamycin B lyase